ncbi:hypothetical protein POTOM_029476 [Populus tomentosa]|uniref:Protein yippee-like n=1 Tax=Populus tomentosa TaxID=118781 RepID=A0A8X7Z913_POPTO|nr:hypothetical protein POTOM_029476 [Populus tomentosa]
MLFGVLMGCKCSDYMFCLCSFIQSFHCRHGKAYLFNKVTSVGSYALGICLVMAWASTCGRGKGEWSARANVFVGEKEERMMITGLHTVADIFCVGCGSIVGWKYETAHERSQKYKEGKSVLERFKVSGPDGSHYWVNHEHHHIGGSDADDV